MGVEYAVNNHPFQHNLLINNNLKIQEPPKKAIEKVIVVAKVVFSILLSLVLFAINPAIFFVSFVIGVAFNKAIQEAVDKIKVFILNYKFPFAVGCVLSGIIVLPVFIATGSVVWAAYMGSYLSTRAQKANQKN